MKFKLFNQYILLVFTLFTLQVKTCYAEIDVTAKPVDENSIIQYVLEVPTFYDPRDIPTSRTSGYVPPVPNQKRESWCWSFAVTGALEAAMHMDGLTPQDLSESHLAFTIFANPVSYKRLRYINDNGISYQIPTATEIRRKGNTIVAALAPLVRLEAPSTESNWPMSYANEQASFPSLSVLPPVRVMGASYLRPYSSKPETPVNTEKVKQIILDRGGVIMSFAENKDLFSSHNGRTSYYTPANSDNTNFAAHAVLIVGWDDAFPKNSFKIQSPGNGAWLARNSWSTDWGDNGYFWLSYHNPSLKGATAFWVKEFENNLQYYGYDTLGLNSILGYNKAESDDKTVVAANVFTANGDIEIQDIGFYTCKDDVDVNIKVFALDETIDLKELTDPTSNMLLANLNTHIALSGFHTITVPKHIFINNGKRFSVMVTLYKHDNIFPVELWFAEQEETYRNAIVNSGESYFLLNGKDWIDGYNLGSTEDPHDLRANATIQVYVKGDSPMLNILPSDRPVIDESRHTPSPYDEQGCNIGIYSHISIYISLTIVSLLFIIRKVCQK